MSSPFDLSTVEGRESEYRRILLRLQAAISRTMNERLGDRVPAFLQTGSTDPQGDWASGIWADVDLPTARLMDAGERFVAGDGTRERVIDTAKHVLDAWTKSIEAFEPEPVQDRPLRR